MRVNLMMNGESPVAISRDDFAEVFEPFVFRHCSANDPEWSTQLARRKRKIIWKGIVKWLLRWIPQHQRLEQSIVDEYSDVWQQTDYNYYSLEVLPPKFSPWEWSGKNMLASAFGGTRLRQLILIRIIQHLKPAKVLEVGCGNGINLLMLSGAFPEIEFTGIELTQAGNEAALHFQQQAVFPDHMRTFLSATMVDDTAFKRIRFLRGSAADLPFEDNQFDLVYTVLALEQMERIRAQALSEIVRVCKRHTLMIEPFYDVNSGGWERSNVVRRDYFQGRIAQLPDYGLQPIQNIDDFPQEYFLKVCAVLSRKQAGGA
jgi:ubiquinone/menaquinone biosynthesis C-methylase UbiE